jgi:hypothetical protein
MKKAVIAIFSMFYLLMSSGLAFTVHYCMGERDAVKLGAVKTKVCGRCGMEEKESKGCCKDEQHLVKIEDDQLTVTATTVPTAFFCDAISPVSVLAGQPSYNEYLPEVFFSDTSPPPLIISRTILFRNFRV